MEISPYMLLLLLIYSFLFGISAGVFNDANRTLRVFLKSKRTNKGLDKLYDTKLIFLKKLMEARFVRKTGKIFFSILIFLQDIALFFYLGCGVVVLNYYMNRGQFRLYTIAAALVGFAVYFFTFGRLVMFLSKGVVYIIRSAMTLLIYLISRPFVWIFAVSKKILFIPCKKILTAIAKRKKLSYNKIGGSEETLEENVDQDVYIKEGKNGF